MPTILCLCVYDFGIKYWSQEDTDHLCNATRATFKHTVEKGGKKYCGLTLHWKHDLGHADTSIPTHVPDTLKRLLREP